MGAARMLDAVFGPFTNTTGYSGILAPVSSACRR